ARGCERKQQLARALPATRVTAQSGTEPRTSPRRFGGLRPQLWRSLYEERNESAQHKEPNDFGLGPDRRDCQEGKEHPKERVLAERFLNQFPRAAHNDRADRRADTVKHSLDPGEPAEMHIQRSQAENHQK